MLRSDIHTGNTYRGAKLLCTSFHIPVHCYQNLLLHRRKHHPDFSGKMISVFHLLPILSGSLRPGQLLYGFE